jgi:hypothetical protein
MCSSYLEEKVDNTPESTSQIMYPYGFAAGDTNATFTACYNGQTSAIPTAEFSFLGSKYSNVYVSVIDLVDFFTMVPRVAKLCRVFA